MMRRAKIRRQGTIWRCRSKNYDGFRYSPDERRDVANWATDSPSKRTPGPLDFLAGYIAYRPVTADGKVSRSTITAHLPGRPDGRRRAKGRRMIKSDLICRIRHQNPYLYLHDVEKIVDALFDEITASLARGKRIELRGFGTFSVKVHEARTGRNPRTGASPSSKKGAPAFQDRKGNEGAAQSTRRVNCRVIRRNVGHRRNSCPRCRAALSVVAPVYLNPPAPQYARAALAQGRNPHAHPRLGGYFDKRGASIRPARAG